MARYVMNLTKIAKDVGSGDKGCPAVYLTENPALIGVQGKRPDAATMANLEDLAADESAVLIPTETIVRAAAIIESRQV